MASFLNTTPNSGPRLELIKFAVSALANLSFTKHFVFFRFPTSFWTQFSILLGRMFLQMRRNKPMLVIQLLHHILSAILVGSIFYKIGDNAGQMIANFKYCLSIVAFFMYTYVMVPVLICKYKVACRV